MKKFLNLQTDEEWSCVSQHINTEKKFEDLSQLLIKRSYRDFVSKILGRKKFRDRNENIVKSMYNQKWINRDSKLEISKGGYVPVSWNTNKFVIEGLGLRKLQTLRIAKLIEKVNPKSVLDIGCGNGERLFHLACFFPNIKFTGLELTQGGVESAKEIQKFDKITDALKESSPFTLKDLTAHKSIEFICASSKSIPFQDNSFDLVYTSLALEQMEQIRENALKEIYRVCKKYASFYEAFKDYNNKFPHLAYIISQSYFRGSVKDLNNLGFRNIQIYDQIPQKVYMNAVFVLAEKNENNLSNNS